MSDVLFTPEQVANMMNTRYSDSVKSQQKELNNALWKLLDLCIITDQEFKILNKRISNAIAGYKDV